jgi:hypothetical protein
MATRFPARLHVLLASMNSSAVVIRRGPAKSVCTIGWDRKTDEFTLGQWLRGRIYERRADLSPNGRYLIYFAMNGKWSSEARGSWTAVSRAPWLHAVALYGKGDCWHGGGLFTSNTKYWLNGAGCYAGVQRESGEVRRDEAYRPEGQYGGECPSVYYRRLQRDGWRLKDKLSAGKFDTCTIFEKELPKDWLLRKYAHEQVGAPPGNGCYWDEHELENTKSGERVLGKKWEWAELDGKSLIWAEGGCLHRAPVLREHLGTAKMIHDFNDMRFEPRAAPY